ncbi:MAG: hypothetical protein GY723_11750 [bacterium]|nr:hypothetical protein [bacterium]
MWLRCDDCDVDAVLATSCKARLVCPRCGGRRMASTAAQLVDHVLPDHRLRQWVVTFPQPLPRLLAWRPDLLKRLLADVAKVVQDDLRRRTGESQGKGGLVSFVQNFTRVQPRDDIVHRHLASIDPGHAARPPVV